MATFEPDKSAIEAETTSGKTGPSKESDSLRKIFLGLFLTLLLVAFYFICRPFLYSVSWAAIVVLGAWPFHARLRRRMPNWPGLAAALSSGLMLLTLVAILLPVVRGLGPELKTASHEMGNFISSREGQARSLIARIPLVGESLSEAVEDLSKESAGLLPLVQEYSQTLFGTASLAAQGLLSFFFQLGVFSLSVFFFLYYGEEFAGQVRAALLKMDPRTENLLRLVQGTVIGVLYGVVFTAVAQGLLAGLGFAVAGVRAPTVLGLGTMFLSFIPFGPQLIYIPVSLSLVLSGSPLAGLLLALWGILVVSSADNVIKPLFIASQVQLPLALVILGVTGGIMKFGLLGVFVGPVVVGLVQNLWLAWTADQILVEEETEDAQLLLFETPELS